MLIMIIVVSMEDFLVFIVIAHNMIPQPVPSVLTKPFVSVSRQYLQDG